MWIIAVAVSLIVGLVIQGAIITTADGPVIAVFAVLIIMGGFIMFQLERLRKDQKTILELLKSTEEKKE